MAYTYAQLVQMGAKPGPSAGSSSAGKSYTYDELTKLGATPGEAPAPAATGAFSPKEGGGLGGFVKSIVSAPITMVARPLQAIAELGGVSDEAVDKFSREQLGGFVAPTPKNYSDVGKDVGRAIQTVALGAAGPVSAGAALGLGTSLEQGNPLFSVKTAFNTALGAVGGKVLDLVGKPLLDATGKVVGKITPQYLRDVASKGTQAMQDFAASHDILPTKVSNAINYGAQKAETIANKPFQAVGNVAQKGVTAAKSVFHPSDEAVVRNRTNILQKLEDNNARMRNFSGKQAGKGFNPKSDIAKTDLLQGSVDDTGTLRTKQPGGAVSQYNEFIRPQESVVGDALRREGKSVPLSQVQNKLIDAVDKSGVKGASRVDALAKVGREIEGYRLEIDPTGKMPVEKMQIPVAEVHAAKVDKYANINYMNESGRVDKTIARTLKEIVEKNTSSANVKALNQELARHYANIGYLEKLDGVKVEGGRLGKHFARLLGAVAGSHFGPLGTIGGAELAGAIKGRMMSSAFGPKVGQELESSALMKSTLAENAAAKKGLGAFGKKPSVIKR